MASQAFNSTPWKLFKKTGSTLTPISQSVSIDWDLKIAEIALLNKDNDGWTNQLESVKTLSGTMKCYVDLTATGIYNMNQLISLVTGSSNSETFVFSDQTTGRYNFTGSFGIYNIKQTAGTESTLEFEAQFKNKGAVTFGTNA